MTTVWRMETSRHEPSHRRYVRPPRLQRNVTSQTFEFLNKISSRGYILLLTNNI
jgi:hypothetical protein